LNRSRWTALVLFIALGLVLAAAAQQKAEETAIDPVCGMTVKKASAKATFDYKGQTYYFCATGCKDRFAKEPDKYLAKTAPAAQAGKTEEPQACCPMMKGGLAPMGPGMMMHGGPRMRHGMRMKMMHGHGKGMRGGPGMMAACPCCGMGDPMMSGDVVRKVEKTADGVVVRITAKDPELVKKIQAHFDMMEKMTAPKAAAAEGCAEGCSEDCPMKKKEVKK
jgi:YHS domain-containing protein